MNSIEKIGLVLLTGLFCCRGMDKDKPVSSIPVRPIDKLRLTDLKNKPIDLKQYEGKTIFLNFWATWCKPCTKEMPSIKKARDILRDEGVVFLMASDESVEEIKEFDSIHNYHFTYAHIENSEELNIQALPTTFIFNAAGKMVFSEIGYRQWDDSNNIEMIRKIIAKND